MSMSLRLWIWEQGGWKGINNGNEWVCGGFEQSWHGDKDVRRRGWMRGMMKNGKTLREREKDERNDENVDFCFLICFLYLCFWILNNEIIFMVD